MPQEQFEREKSYWASMAVVKVLFVKRLITRREYLTIETKLRAKWRPLFGSIPA